MNVVQFKSKILWFLWFMYFFSVCYENEYPKFRYLNSFVSKENDWCEEKTTFVLSSWLKEKKYKIIVFFRVNFFMWCDPIKMWWWINNKEMEALNENVEMYWRLKRETFHVWMCRCRVQIEVKFFGIFSVISFRSSESKNSFFKNRICIKTLNS